MGKRGDAHGWWFTAEITIRIDSRRCEEVHELEFEMHAVYSMKVLQIWPYQLQQPNDFFQPCSQFDVGVEARVLTLQKSEVISFPLSNPSPSLSRFDFFASHL